MKAIGAEADRQARRREGRGSKLSRMRLQELERGGGAERVRDYPYGVIVKHSVNELAPSDPYSDHSVIAAVV